VENVDSLGRSCGEKGRECFWVVCETFGMGNDRNGENVSSKGL